MSNWVTLPNGVHIDLDDPNNPLTGDGSFESYLGGNKGDSGNKGSVESKIADLKAKRQEAIKNYNKTGDEKYSKQERELTKQIDSLKNEKFESNRAKENAPKQDDGFMEWYNSLSEQDRASIDRQMHADKEVGAKYGFTPTKQTIWNDKNHPLYGIAPSEQDEDYLKSAIAEMSRYSNRWSTMSKSEKNEISPNGKAALDNKIKQYSKALKYIKSFK